MNVEFTKGVLSELELQLIEGAAKAINLEVVRYTVRDTTMIHRKVPTRFGPMNAVWNPLDPNTGHYLDLLQHASVRIETRQGHDGAVGLEIEITTVAGGWATRALYPGHMDVPVTLCRLLVEAADAAYQLNP
jgi:hypothetical protein